MYVCICNAVTEKDIHHAAANGARRVRDLRVLGVTADCGKCACAAKCCLDQALTSTVNPVRRPTPTPTRHMEAFA
ncbi:(2Fe-2S)-binding protein [Denitromonas sp.]|uniref:(2Fe-2S)-binding protein n=1 Tax=Denitromonas sp. TaxID=2734609 RepID=UPI002FDE9E2F